jgi:hypothetical protein
MTTTRRGELSFEGILGMAFLSLVLATVIAVMQFYNTRNPADPENHDITRNYNTILTCMREDSQITAFAETASDSVALFDSQSELVSKYILNARSLQRFDKNGKGEILLKEVEAVSFKTAEDLQNLLTVKILPADRMDIPFFTSFALRGVNNDLN